jgi:hypothetical protein
VQNTNGPDERVRAYAAGARISREKMAREAPLDAAALEAVQGADIVVVEGNYDHVERVLHALELPYRRVTPAHLEELRLQPEQLLVVNCPGNVSRAALERIRRFVEAGGSLFTTDWALRHVIEPAFPAMLAYNERATADDVVRIEVCDHDNPFLTGVMDGRDDPQWWLEGSSYPIRVLSPAVSVLITSRELEEKYGEAAVAVTFPWGRGEVFHMISHYYLQRTELRTARHAAGATAYWTEKGVPPPPPPMVDGLALGDVESASTSARMLANLIAAKKRRHQGLGSE